MMFGRLTAAGVAAMLIGAIRLLTGVQARWLGCGPSDVQRVYFANHTSHADFILIWAVFSRQLRRRTWPVAARDYWSQGAVRRYLMDRVFHGVLIDRGHVDRTRNPIAALTQALDQGASIILFPEGTRGPGEQVQQFKSGLFHLAQSKPEAEFVPVWIDNAYRVLPKGVLFPIPLLCTVTFGEPLRLVPGEQKGEFLERLRHSLVALGGA